ncbi:MAG TPA: SDR family NAD(P)-dependent oxidoreductase [Gammaproteobacteria bacterium]|nr:SDR family NAD(P)-dependent oxidoreductase [Gammaproteobacteria bacterium]
MEIKNSVALISGGASGMGAATARRLAKAGAKVALLDVNQEAAEALAEEIKGLALFCDVSKAESVEKAVHEVNKKLGPARLCLNCAGVVISKRMVGKAGPLPLEEFQALININLCGTFNLMRMAAHTMTTLEPLESGERGLIINTASIAAYEGQIGQVAYSASKGGIVGMTLPAARELAQFGIRVMTIAPGLVNTPLFEKLPEETKQTLAAAVPFPKRLAKPEEFAQLVQQIIENPMLNGSVIRLDGALRMQAK